MKPISPSGRQVANIRTGQFVPFLGSNGEPDGEVLQVNGGKTGYGFHVYRMQPGQKTIAHKHIGAEEFYIIEGDLTDHDGYRYGPGDLVYLSDGTEHYSVSETGCLLVVYLPGAEGF
jgi:quercetin dioxygenase-like cupin family protein